MEVILNVRKRCGNGAAFATSFTSASRILMCDEDVVVNDGLVFFKFLLCG